MTVSATNLDCSSVAHSASQVVCIVQPPDWRIYITPALVAISVLIGWLALRNTRAVARQRATLDLIEKVESTEHYRTNRDTFFDLQRGNGFDHLHNPKDDQAKAQRRCITDYLNHYELISIGILENILDEKIYRGWMEAAFVRDWNDAAAFIQRERWKRRADGSWYYFPKHFEHYQCVAESWSKDAAALDKFYSGPPADDEAGGPGDAPLPSSTEEPLEEKNDE